MNIYQLVADRLTKDERHTLWVEADENPNFIDNLIVELNREVPLEDYKVEDGELDGSEVVLNFADLPPADLPAGVGPAYKFFGTLMTPAGAVSGTLENGVFHADETKWAGGPPASEVLKHEREEHDDDRTRGDRRPIHERMRNGGVRLGELVDTMFMDPSALVHTLNGLYFLDLGTAQPEMDEGEEIWDGAFEYDGEVIRYAGSTKPSGGGLAVSKVLSDDTLIELF